MNPPIIFPDAALWATGWLFRQMSQMNFPWISSLSFSGSIPRDGERPGHLVSIIRDGGLTLDHEDHPRLRINVWAPTDAEADEISRVVSALLRVAGTDENCPAVSADLTGPSPVPDPSGGSRRVFWASLVVLARDN